jgi:hypothetical protein
MSMLRMPASPRADRADRAGVETNPQAVIHHDERIHHDEPNAGLLEGELLDLYVAIVIVVPLALFLKSLLF